MPAQNSAIVRETYKRLLAQDSATLRQLALSTLELARGRLAEVRNLGGGWAGRWKAAETIDQEAAGHVIEAQNATDETGRRRQYALAYMSADLMLQTLKEEEAAGSTASQIAADGAQAIGDLARRAAGGAFDLIPTDVKVAAGIAAAGLASLSLISLWAALRRPKA